MEASFPSSPPTYTDPAGLHPPVARAGVLFLDGNGNGTMDVVAGSPGCADLDGNGRLDAGEDYLLRPLATYETGAFLLHYSLEVTAQAEARGLFGGDWPDDVADIAYADEYWSWRDATRFYGEIGAVRPDLHAMLVFAASDHVQASDEHLHIQQAYDGLRAQGIWCRLNPDRAYFYEVNPSPPGTPCDHDANVPTSWPAMAAFHEPHPISSTQGAAAAIMEMADRAHAGVWDANVGGLIPSEPSRVVPIDEAPAAVRILPHPVTTGSVVTWQGDWGGPLKLRLLSHDGRLLGSRTVDGATAGALRFEQLATGCPLARGRYLLEARGPLRRMTIAALLLN